MWGHYAGGHTGFCVEFDISKDPLFQKARQVTYAPDFPVLDVNRIASGDFGQTLDLLTTKSPCWSYEKEWRVLHREGSKLYHVDRPAFERVIFGAKMDEAHQRLIAKLLHGVTDTKFARMHLHKSNFQLVCEDVDFTPLDWRQGTS